MFPQAVDVYIQGAVVALKIIAPDIFDQLLARKRPARITGQLEQQLELFEWQSHFLAGHAHFESLAVHQQFPHLHRLRSHDAVAFQQGFHACHQFQRLERFDQVVIRPQLEALELLADLAPGSQHQNRQIVGRP